MLMKKRSAGTHLLRCFSFQGLDLGCSLPLPRTFVPSSSRPEYGSLAAARAPLLEKTYKAPTPWEAASRHPLGLVDEAFSSQSPRQLIASCVTSAARRKSLPEPPADWKARVSCEAPERASFSSPARSVVSAPAAPLPYASPRWRPVKQQSYTSTYSAAWRW
ncbi:hypothetical protein Z043_109453 [Scleropages formosus]|uniref:Uncharacterized protein n=1 Tax=Scleropages formosus TaxID=113540 RepID=A0A0N8K0A8_SCLFO|nr:hypothetical protein Z043_109453 [Scleropages formosus]